MKKIYNIIFSALLVLNAQTAEQIKDQLKDPSISPDKAKLISNVQGMTDQKIESSTKSSDIDPDNEVVKKDPSQTPSEVIEIDGIKYIKDGFRYIPIIDTEVITIEPTAETEIPTVENIITSPIKNLNYFGYQIFSGDPTAFQASTFGAVDPNYNIGPGDQIIVMLWGEFQDRQELTIDREGYVFVPEVGQVFVNGLNLDALEKKFFQILSKVYSTLKPITGKPSTFMDISLGDLRPLRIIVLGEVGQPGAYSVSPSTSLSSSLYYFGGPTTLGSLRDIRLIRQNKTIGNLDFYEYLLSGENPNDLRLQLDDVVFIPPRGKTVTIHGEINRQGIYELKETDGLEELLQIAGGLLVTAYMKRAQINRILSVEERSRLGMDRMVIDIDLEVAIADNQDTELQDGDVLEIFSIEDLQKNYVIVQGSSVIRPGRYQLLPDMRVMDLINNADGLLNNAYLSIAHIMRLNDDLTTELIQIDLGKAVSGDQENNIRLQSMDELNIYNMNYLKNMFPKVIVNGPVKSPGIYNLENNKKLNDLIVAAGGFNDGINKVKILIARVDPNIFSPILYKIPSVKSGNKFIDIRSLDDPEDEVNHFVLNPKDVVNIFSDPKDQMSGTIEISGAVYYPGSYPILSSKEKVSDIIKRAGGLLPEAYPMASNFIRSGQSVRLSFKKILNNPNNKENFAVMSGDQIEINRKPNTVQVVGEVNSPGLFKYYDGYTLRDYIDISGGLSTDAERKEILVTYPDGSSKQLKFLMPAPKVYDGSVISVGQADESEPLDKTEFAKELASIISDFLQLALTLVLISNTYSG